MKTKKRKLCQLLLIGTFFLFGIVQQGRTETPEALAKLTEQFVMSQDHSQYRNIQLRVQALPAASSKKNCSHPPDVRFNGAQRVGNITVAIRCKQPAWQQYVSATLSADIAAIATTRDIAAGHTIDNSMLTQQWISANTLRPQHLTRIEDVQDQTARQFIAAGTILASNMLKPTILIEKGQLIRIISESEHIRIEMDGIALESGERDKHIRVKNLSSNKTVQAKVISADSVVVP